MSRRRQPDHEAPPLIAAGEVAGEAAAHTLMVRLWREAHANAMTRPVWRGTVSDLRGRQLGSFSSAAELVGILGDISGIGVLLRVSCMEKATGAND